MNFSGDNDRSDSDDSGDDCSDDEEMVRTAYHEAGHCVMAVICGAHAHHASIATEEDNFFGKVDIQWPGRRPLENELSVILAGPVAEMIYRSEPLHPGFVPEWSLDWQQAWMLARPRHGSDVKCLAVLENLIAKLHRTMSDDRIWAAIAAVQDLLMAHDDVDHEQIEYEVRAWVDA